MLRSVALTTLLAIAMPTAYAAKLTPETTAMRVPVASVQGKDAAVIVIENRAEVLEGDKKETYEGVSRELYGIPIPRATKDGSTMATYLGQRLEIGFRRAGYEASFAPSRKASDPEELVQKLEIKNDGLAFVVDLRDWHYDFGGFRPSFLYDVTVLVYSSEKKLLAKKDFSGMELMPTGGWKHFKARYAELYQTIFDRIFETAEIRQALDGKASLASTAKGTTEERLTQLKHLLDQGLIDQKTFDSEKQRIVSEI